jgi:uncharacterized protein YndB with AHSA1/START domain
MRASTPSWQKRQTINPRKELRMPGPVTITTPSDLEIVLTRDFAAPPQRLFDCHTRPELMRRWMTPPPGWAFVSCEIDARVGGTFRNEFKNLATGDIVAVHGVYTVMDPPHRIAHTELADGHPGESVETTAFAEIPGGTRLTNTWSFTSKAARDAALQSGMVDGMAAPYDKLDDLLVEA